MNRKIKFRGKTKVDFGNGDNEILIPKGTWIYGGIVFDDSERIWIDMKYYGQILVDENTVGQYTGLHDKNGKEIYERDIVKYRDSRGEHIENVIFDKGCFYAGMHWGSSTRVAPKLINPRITEVIGNEFDNPELLGGE